MFWEGFYKRAGIFGKGRRAMDALRSKGKATQISTGTPANRVDKAVQYRKSLGKVRTPVAAPKVQTSGRAMGLEAVPKRNRNYADL